MRGIAVLAVLAFHAFPAALPGGMLGVDIFFAISGFLVTGIVLRHLSDGDFNLAAFFMRRARRILPACYTTLVITTIFAHLLLSSAQWYEYLDQLFGAVTFTANFTMYRQSTYFAVEAQTKLLLHIWSLSVEEQFYLLMPMILLACRARWRVLALGLLFSSSLMVFLWGFLSARHSSFFFYLLPARAWELLAGSLCAFAVSRWPGLSVPAFVKWAALTIILAVCSRAPESAAAPLLAILATCVILLGKNNWLRSNPLSRPVATVGDWSYSLYLVHWPVLCFARILYVGTSPNRLTLLLAAACIPLAWLQYRYVEQRWRFATGAAGPMWVRLGAATAGLLALALPGPLRHLSPLPNGAGLPAAGLGLGALCTGEKRSCRTSDAPEIAIWGDSFAMQFASALHDRRETSGTLIQFTAPGCAPTPGVVAATSIASTLTPARCQQFNESSLRRIAATPSIRAVLISSYFLPFYRNQSPELIVDGQRQRWAPVAVERLASAVRLLQRAGKVVILVGPIPSEGASGFHAGWCNIRQRERLPLLGRSDCTISRSTYRMRLQPVLVPLRQVAAQTGAGLFLPEDVLCTGASCATMVEGRLIYRDWGHLSREGAVWIVERLGIGTALGRAIAGPGK